FALQLVQQRKRIAARYDLGRRLVQEEYVQVVGAQPAQAAFDSATDVLRFEALTLAVASHPQHRVARARPASEQRTEQGLDVTYAELRPAQNEARLGTEDHPLAARPEQL